jgi:hypothetical protein
MLVVTVSPKFQVVMPRRRGEADAVPGVRHARRRD